MMESTFKFIIIQSQNYPATKPLNKIWLQLMYCQNASVIRAAEMGVDTNIVEELKS